MGRDRGARVFIGAPLAAYPGVMWSTATNQHQLRHQPAALGAVEHAFSGQLEAGGGTIGSTKSERPA